VCVCVPGRVRHHRVEEMEGGFMTHIQVDRDN